MTLLDYGVDTFLDMETLHVELNTLTALKYSNLQELINREEQVQDKTYNKCFRVASDPIYVTSQHSTFVDDKS